MILELKSIQLFGEELFTYGVAQAPFSLPNSMPNEACFAYVLEGENRIFAEKQSLNLVSNEAVLMKCGNYVSHLFSDLKDERCSAITIHFHPEMLKKAYGNELPNFLKNQKEAENHTMVHIKASEMLKKYVESVLFYMENPQLTNEDILVLKLKELILLLLQTKDSPQILEILNKLFSPRTASFKDVIETHIFSSLTSAELALLANHSLSSFKREFKKIYNDSPSNYIQNKRLEKAVDLLVVSEDSISNIAYDCGFTSAAHFSKAFKAKLNATPSEYRLDLLSKK